MKTAQPLGLRLHVWPPRWAAAGFGQRTAAGSSLSLVGGRFMVLIFSGSAWSALALAAATVQSV